MIVTIVVYRPSTMRWRGEIRRKKQINYFRKYGFTN